MSTDLQDAIEAAAQDLAESYVWALDRLTVGPDAQRPLPAREDVALAAQAIQRTLAALFLFVVEVKEA